MSNYKIYGVDCDDLFEKGVSGVNATDGRFDNSTTSMYQENGSAGTLKGYTYYAKPEPDAPLLPVLDFGKSANIGKPWGWVSLVGYNSEHIKSNLASVPEYYKLNGSSISKLLCINGRCPIGTSSGIGVSLGPPSAGGYVYVKICRLGTNPSYIRYTTKATGWPADPTTSDNYISGMNNKSWIIATVIGGGGAGGNVNDRSGGGAGGIARAVFKLPLQQIFYGIIGGGGKTNGDKAAEVLAGNYSIFGDLNFVTSIVTSAQEISGQGILAYGGGKGTYLGNSGGSYVVKEGDLCVWARGAAGGAGGNRANGDMAATNGSGATFSWEKPNWGARSEFLKVSATGKSKVSLGYADGGGGGGAWCGYGGGGSGRASNFSGSNVQEQTSGDAGALAIAYD